MPAANKNLKEKLSALPKNPGVYFHKDSQGRIIYVGKAANLNNRVRQYFHASALRDVKTEALVTEIVDVDWVEVETELDALFLEAEMIRRYQPKFNILLRDDKSLSFIRIDIASDHPTVNLVRRPLDDRAEYFGPYYSAATIRRALRYLRKVFPFDWRKPGSGKKRASLDYHIGLSPGLEQGKTSLNDYRKNLKQLMKYLKGGRHSISQDIEKKMKSAAQKQAFEQATKYRNQLNALRNLRRQIVFSDREFMDLSKDYGLNELARILGITESLRRIEGYDISHMSGTDNVASMVVFINGMPDKTAYRKFKLRISGNDDFRHINEVVGRRLTDKNRSAWILPNLFLIDGGKGQLNAAISALKEKDIKRPIIGLAKQQEQIIVNKLWSSVNISKEAIKSLNGTIEESDEFYIINIPHESHVVKLLQRIRDESHRFAVSYHSSLKVKRVTSSLLDFIPDIGPVTKRKLLRHFKSIKAIEAAPISELEQLVGQKRALLIKKYLGKGDLDSL